MKTTQILALSVCIILIAICGITDAGEKKLLNVEVPLPDDIKIVAPTKDVSKKIAAFSGVWEGKWIRVREAALVVEEINSKEAKVIYCEGEMLGVYTSPASCERYKANVTPENLQIEFRPDEIKRFTFIMENNLNQIKGTYESPLGNYEIIMIKIE